MLQIQRASAGSGKTFTLAKKYIWFLIAVRPEGKGWRLRTRKEISDGLPRILAVTFTNKATNEMKQRIVDKLASLAKAETGKLTDEEASRIDYLDEFASSLGVERSEIGKSCRMALELLLNDYSDFRVSTIDSFFQTILRTFAYESNLNDSYQVEIDTEFLAAAAVDATLDEINNAPLSSNASFWMRELIRREADAGKTTWNVFQKSDRRDSIYTRLKKSVMRLENENFKKIRNELNDYFNTADGSDPLIPVYVSLRDLIRESLVAPLEKARRNALLLRDLFSRNSLDPETDGRRWLAGHIVKLQKLAYNEPATSNLIFKPLSMDNANPVLKKGVACADSQKMTEVATEMYEAYIEWCELRDNGPWKLWEIYSNLLPYLGLLGEAIKKMSSLLEANNSIQLGETNSMLRRIIGKDDTPFIYERLGSHINHYLIDEFQDTSKMQWENLYPLLWESDSRGEDNLIIGDAKQSIYRFRNADPSLITSRVPEAFPIHKAGGMSKADNTNWRSDRTVVEFNNSFFNSLIDKISSFAQGTIDFRNLYSNVAQYASHRDRKGYVEINFISKPEDTDDSVSDATKTKKELIRDIALSRLGPLASSLIERGYRQRDIAFLVDTNELGKEVIDTLVKYNASLPEGVAPIEFISEESLLVSSSDAVGIIISVLEKMSKGTDIHKNESSDSSRTSWNDIRCNFSFFALRNPDMSPARQIEAFLDGEGNTDAITEMLSDMQTVALPALVEAITENFVPTDMRISQAAFIAAFQDLVLDYCDAYPTDISSFLHWWNTKGLTRSISSPEGTDAVQIMTIHKSKGLEFKCVILPFADSSFQPGNKSEWEWVRPDKFFTDYGFPPFLPIELTSRLKGTIHEDLWIRYVDLNIMDRLNSCYVAFTRAVSELYVFTEMPERKDGKNIGSFLYDFFNSADGSLPLGSGMESDDYLLPPGMTAWNDTHDSASVGSLPVPEIKKEKHDQEQDETSGRRVISEYNPDSSPAFLHYVADNDDLPLSSPTDTEDPDPRSEGNLLHAVMEKVKVKSDLKKALNTLLMRGLISDSTSHDWEKMLSEAMGNPVVSEWFRPGWNVMNERSVLAPGFVKKRPDRIMIAPDRQSAVVVDYKFGNEPEGNSHKNQVKEYILSIISATGITNVTGFIWYVKSGKVIKVVP